MTVHQSPVRLEAALKATGRAVYEAETPMVGMLHAALIQSPIAGGRLLGLDLERVRAMPGFADLVSHAEAQVLAPSPPLALVREPAIHFAGQPLGLVVAETLQEAEACARAVPLELAPEPAVTAMSQALDTAFAPDLAGRYPPSSQRGDAAAALAAAHLVVRHRYDTAVNNHHPMEPHSVVCAWEDDRVVVHNGTQAVFLTQRIVAHSFQIPVEQVRVVSRFVGGGFGCKGPLWLPWLMWTILASRRTGRPVRLELTRAQLFNLVGRRQETVQDLALGFDADGRLTAIDHQVLAQTATHGDYSDATATTSRSLYACANVTTGHRVVRTNEPLPVAMRAPGVAPGTFALESAMDEAAEALGIDPVELRVRNYAHRDLDADKPWSSNGLLDCYTAAAERFGWAGRPAPGQARDGYWRIGVGMASSVYPVHRQPCRVKVRIDADAGLLVQCGTQDFGQGLYTAMGQLAADGLGIDMGQVRVELGDTDLPEGPFTGGSMVTASFAPAVDDAVAILRARLAELAAAGAGSPLAGADPSDLIFEGGLVRSGSRDAAERLVDLMARCAPEGLEAEGAATLPEAQPFSANGYGAVFVEVGVDPDLGEVRVRRCVAAFAAGRIINAQMAHSQYVGGLIGGIGMALHEQVDTDKATGRIVGDNLADYLIPTHADMPEFDVTMLDEDDPLLPSGIKGIGMLGSAGIQAAIANAVHDAVGKRVRRLPIRIEEILGQ
ncbi:xanthine dehydrogenase family protein molybdopterin-binding subunit [Cupriavidus basilensis]|uniref:xanthine dehydrogenase family protein molybdopterin-binding subunit n=1 Tax=Cupriavidus basilensis TaxID=68895 RepID=UPI00157A6561|nr:xanthine dehydrogenase family protein molybdopterin-binding subunit [Cupriavidus basilensis]